MRLAGIFLAVCILSCLLPSHFSKGVTAGQIRPWCPSKQQVFSGSCPNDGGQQCVNDLLSTWYPYVRLSPISCKCSPQSNNMRLCSF
ncbi:defensin-like protein 249 [Raphanus sativus]|uniref:Defensin-like protein 249 n=1 Tax=Raphanus sativus TaxID=3726 RepID=A0A9W3BUC5_RAPSA|nr:defensin-like protein 249 [Raphanus sativus]